MAQVQQLLKYQEVDRKLLEIEKEKASSEERKNFVQAKNFLLKASEKLDTLEAKAIELKSILSKLNEKYDEISETLGEFENLDELLDEDAGVAFYKKNILQLIDSLHSVKAEISSLVKSVKDADEEYRAMKKKVLEVQKKYNEEYAPNYKKYTEVKEKEMAVVRKELDELKKGIDPAIMQKYESKRGERIFPILCSVKNGRCSKCGNELSLSGKEKITSGAVVECDYCHRFLYQE